MGLKRKPPVCPSGLWRLIFFRQSFSGSLAELFLQFEILSLIFATACL